MRWWHTLTRDQRLLLINSAMTGFGVSLFLYLQPLYIAGLGASPQEIGLTLGIGSGLATLLYIPMGWWADRRGRKSLIVVGWALSSLATFGMAFAPDWRWFIPALVVYWLSNIAVPALQGYIAAGETPRNVSRVFSILASGNAVGSVVAPAVGGWMGEAFGLRTVYFTAAAIFGALTWALTRLTEQTVVVASAPRAHARQVLTRRDFVLQIGFIFALFFVVDVGQVMTPKFLEDVRGLSVGQIGALGSVGTLGIMVLTLLLGRQPPERRAPLLLAQGAALLALLLWLNASALAWIGLAYFVHGGNRVIRPITTGRLAATLDAATMSFGFGFYQTAQQLGLTLSPYVAGLLYARGPAWPLWAGVAGLLVMMLLTWRMSDGLSRTEKGVDPEARPHRTADG